MTHDEYLLLNGVQRDGYKEQSEIKGFDLLKKKLWIQRCPEMPYALTDDVFWQLSSQGHLEHNLYEKQNGYSDGCKQKKRDVCPRCGDTDPSCKICCGYTATGKIHSH